MQAIIRNSDNRAAQSVPIIAIDKTNFDAVCKALEPSANAWLEQHRFRPGSAGFMVVPDSTTGRIRCVLVDVSDANALWALAALPAALPCGTYHIDDAQSVAMDWQQAVMGWALAAYQFKRYHKPTREPAALAVSETLAQATEPLIRAVYQVRDLVNTPTSDMGPETLANAVKDLAGKHEASIDEWVGDALLEHNFPTIHMVGRASHRAPRLVRLQWGNPQHPAVTLIGKGVCFDTGGLDLKPSASMRWMKKDMGGAAHAIALADLVMQARLPVHLTLLVPAVENSVAGNAMRPGEVVKTRAGLTVEVDNTDAEGRLILCDALQFAAESQPELIIDFATLTGAARVALGPDIPAFFSNRDTLAAAVDTASQDSADPLWRLPLWQDYKRMLKSYIADIANAANTGHAGAITAALYLQHFVPDSTAWVHIDTFAWNNEARPGRPKGGEAQGLRAMFALLQSRYPAA